MRKLVLIGVLVVCPAGLAVAQQAATMSQGQMDVLDRNKDGMTMGALSESLLVSNGNVTGLVKKLVADGLVEMRKLPEDRRSSIVRLTPEGHHQFQRLARAHNDWIDQLLSGLNYTQRERLYVALGVVKMSIGSAAATRKKR